MKSLTKPSKTNEIKNSDLKENEPNAAQVIKALRHLGYNNVTALDDLTDNSIDGGATRISLSILKDGDSFLFRLVDNGQGMDKEELDQALRLGSITNRNPVKDLGLYGMGLVTASISIAKRVHVLTRKTGSPVLFSIFDVDQAIDFNTFDNPRGMASEEDIKLFNQLVGNGSSGTVITLRKCDKLQYKTPETYENKMLSEYGRVYRYLLNSPNRIEMFVNDLKVIPVDPLRIDEKGTEIFMDKTITFNSKETKKSHAIRIKLVKLREFSSQEAKDQKINQVNQGFYVLRNYREIAKGETLHLFNRHNDYNRFRAEILVNGELDDDLGVNFTKKYLALTQGLQNKLQQEIAGQIETIRSQLKKDKVKDKTKEIDHTSSAKIIENKSKLLIGPKQLKKPEASNEIDEDPIQDLTYGDLNFSFEKVHLGNQGQIYEAEQGPNDIIIKLNVDHPFYERFVAENRDNVDIVDASDFLVCCLALAELAYREGTSQRDMFVMFKDLISSNMRQLLS